MFKNYLFHDFLPYNLLFYSKLLYIILKDSCRSTYVKEILYNNNIVNTGGADNNHLIDDIFIKEIFNMYNFSNNFIYSDTFFSNTNVFSSENNNTFNALIKYQKLSYSFSRIKIAKNPLEEIPCSIFQSRFSVMRDHLW